MPETLAEELVLLAHDIRGKCRIAPVELDCGVGGALLSELGLGGRLVVQDTVLVASGDAPTGHPILDGLLAEVAASPRSRTPQEWVTHLGTSDLRDRLLTRMAEHGQVDVDRRRTLGVFAETRFPVRDIVGLWEAQQRVVAAVTTQCAPDRRTLALGALVAAAGLGKAVFATSGDWRTLRGRMRSMTEGDWAAEAVHRALVAERKSASV